MYFRIITLYFRNHLRILKNWHQYDTNKYVILLSGLLFIAINVLLVKINFFQKNLILFFVIIYYLSLAATNFYHKITNSEILFLKNFFSNRQIQLLMFLKSVLSYFTINLIILLFLYLGGVRNIFKQEYFLIYTLIVFITSLVHHLFLGKNNLNSKSNFNLNKIWDFKISKKNLSLRGIILRDLLFIFRNNKKEILKLLFYLFFVNVFFMLFIVNNQKYDFISWAIFLQANIILFHILSSSTELNEKLFTNFDCIKIDVLKAEFLFCFFVITFEISLTTLIYFIAIGTTPIYSIFIICLAIYFMLFYIILIRIANHDSPANKLILYVIMFLPVTIPFTIFNSIKKIKC